MVPRQTDYELHTCIKCSPYGSLSFITRYYVMWITIVPFAEAPFGEEEEDV
jgi:hypothetical protein